MDPPDTQPTSSAPIEAVLPVRNLVEHLRELVPYLIGSTAGEIATMLEEKAAEKDLLKFIDDSQVYTLVIGRAVKDKEEEEEKEEDGDKDRPQEERPQPLLFSLDPGAVTSKHSAVIFVKRVPVLLRDKVITSQLRSITFSEGQPFEILHSFVHHAISPFLNSAINAQKAGEKLGVKGIKTAVSDLELSLVHLQQDIDIPEISLAIHPIIKQVMNEAIEQGRKPTVEDFNSRIDDVQFMTSVSKFVTRWIREIQKVTRLDRDPSTGTAMQEVSFWLNLERALLSIKDKRDGPEVVMTLDLLKHGKRFHATVGFDSDTGLAKSLETVANYNQLMKEFPLSGLLSATTTDAIRAAIVNIFNHMKKIRNTSYPVARTLKLIQTISSDLSDQLLRVVRNEGLMHISYADFERVVGGCRKVFQTWDEEDEKFRNTLRDLLKKKRDDTVKTFRRVNPEHKPLQDRLEELSNFRKQHEQLRTVIVRVLRPSGSASADGLMDADDQSAIEEVNLAYEDAKQADVLDLTESGLKHWEAAKRRYDERIDGVETRITARLRDQLGKAKNANEMFRIFGKFNALFVRPKIRGAIREYQTQLIQRVKADIEKLQEKFKVLYPSTVNAHMSEVRDIPPVSGQIIWARQIDRQLTAYMRRVEDVLGRGWENHVEGQVLKRDGDSFRSKLDTQALFDKWLADVQARQSGAGGHIFDIEHRRGQENQLYLLVNFHPQIITLSKEVRNLKWLGFRVPLVIVNKALQANHFYPFAVSLKASLRTYQQTIEKLAGQSQLKRLVASYHKAIQLRVTEGVGLRWESYRLEAFVQALASSVTIFQEKVDEMLVSSRAIKEAVDSLETVPMRLEDLTAVINTIQKVVDDLNLRSYVNLHRFVADVDADVEAKLVKRLSTALHNWVVVLENYGKKTEEWDDGPVLASSTGENGNGSGNGDGAESGAGASAGQIEGDASRPVIVAMEHEILVRNQVMILNPPAERAREKLLEQLQRFLTVITELPRVQSTRYQVGMDLGDADKSSLTYRSLLTRLPNGNAELLKAYHLIDSNLNAATQYVQVWLQYQALWDMQTDAILSRVGDDLERWKELLVEIKRARKTFDTSETSKSFGPIIINYAQVQSRVNMKYDALHKDILGRFGAKLGGSINDFYLVLQKARTDLESQSIETASTSEAVTFITVLQDYKRKVKKWTDDMDTYRGGQKLLERQRFAFPNDWLYIDNLEGEWDAFSDILTRKNGAIQGRVPMLQMKVVEEDRQLERRVTELLGDWDKNKPVGGDINPDQAVNTLAIYESRFVRAKEEYESLSKAKNALDLDVKPDDRLEPRLEELRDLKSSWSELSRVWSNINDLKNLNWSAVQPRKIRASLDDLVNQMKNLPPRVRTYASYEHTQATLKDYIKANMQLMALKSDALKERHWKILMKNLRVNWILQDLTLGQVWEADLVKNHKAIEEVMLVAQGENALEEFLKQVKEEWNAYELEMVNYQNKTRLIKGWDNLFLKVKEHINSLTAMKMSPYYKVFEEEAGAWDDKLNRVNALFDVWIDVQRKWVYLEGIFSGSADIKHLLPTETSRFESISAEFLALMKKVSKSPMVLEVVQIPNAQRALERLADLLSKIQKALGEYLERERSSFPRFYFVGNEDLLDIIGNSKNVDRLQKHFKNMFAGVQTILLAEDNSECRGLCSREGEEVVFKTPVQIKEVKINTWLTNLEREMKITLAKLLAEAVDVVERFRTQGFVLDQYITWLDTYQAQLVVLAAQVSWSQSVEVALKAVEASGDTSKLQQVVKSIETTLQGLADTVLLHQPAIRRKKLEHMITELVHQRDVTRELVAGGVGSVSDFRWLSQMRFYFNPKEADVLRQLTIEMADAKFFYGFEYLGMIDKLVQTPLTDRCYLTMTQALQARQGGSPFGPAGTGKTESVKALGNQLGRFVLVFNCDETFDFHAMGRIFVGLCQVGAWGCFDEFNRLEERMLSAVSQQIQSIQLALKDAALHNTKDIQVELLGRTIPVHQDMAIFITMNPGYAGRSNLPDNLKKLFRNLAMTKPDRQLIAQVMLYSQGFRTAEMLATKVVPLFILCDEQLSAQSHYDFGLRALKAVLVTAGNIKRDRLVESREAVLSLGGVIDEEKIAASIDEQEVLIQSITQTMIPKLVSDDIPLLRSLLSDVFPGVNYAPRSLESLRAMLEKVAAEWHYVITETFLTKMLQLYQVTNINHGLMLVGPSGSGKSAAWRILLEALQRLENVEGVAHVIDPKAIIKDDLYGTLDPTTREWTDGLLTHIVRKIIDNVRGELNKRQWIIFDGDVDPEWVENLNSVLDDNKLLTLPNGERLALPRNIRIIFEVQDLRNATLATVSRCGMVWFSDDVLSLDMHFKRFLTRLREVPLDGFDASKTGEAVSPAMAVQVAAAGCLAPHLSSGGVVQRAIEHAAQMEHIMSYTSMRALNSLFSMITQSVRKCLQYNESHQEFPLNIDQVEQYLQRRLVYSLLWCIVGDSRSAVRIEFERYVRRSCTINLPPDNDNIMDYEVQLPEGNWVAWKNKVPTIEIDTHRIAGTDVVVPTLDTVRHEDLLYTWLVDHLPIVLCGPPGSGKTMTLFAALRALPDFEVAGLNFSSHTTPELILKTFDQWCEYRRTPNGIVLSPTQLNKWLVVFCDEINLPAMDKYSTVRVITFMRQMVERGGFWRTSDHTWIRLERIQFVGACNPPTDPGRVPLDLRFLRHVPVVYVDYPGPESLRMIYGTFNRALMRTQPNLRTMAEPLTDAMVDFFSQTAQHFTADMQPHYIYSPREMTRWVKGVAEAIAPLEALDPEGLVRIWAHEALRLFSDRLVYDAERQWTDERINAVAEKHFPGLNHLRALERPILFSNWLTKEYISVERERLREFTKARLKVFYEEELDVPLVLFDEVLDHVLRIDRIFRQNQGHLLLIGASGAGKTTLSRFVAWMNGLSVYQVKAHKNYTADNFDEDLRNVLRRSGTKGEKIVFIMDEGNVMDTAFLERMNTLLANGEVPGLFEGDEYSTLMTACKEGTQREGLVLDGNDELYKWFSQQVMNNLHVVFTMNPSEAGLQDRAATSPALFNRCVLDWFGDWSDGALFQVALEFTSHVDLEKPAYEPPMAFPVAYPALPSPPTYRQACINACVFVHKSVQAAARRMLKREGRSTHITPRHYLEFVNQFVKIYNEKRSDLEEQQLHLNVGLKKILETVSQVEELQKSLAAKSAQLEAKNLAANAKLQQMVQDQQAAEEKKAASQIIEKELTVSQAQVDEKKTSVMRDLAQVEPALLEAKEAVEGVKRKDLQELKTMAHPPPTVKLALEAVLCLLGEPSTDWKHIRSVVVQDDFLKKVLEFDSDKVTQSTQETFKQYLNDPEFTVERAMRASKAAGPLVSWARASNLYSQMLLSIGPLRAELSGLEMATVRMRAEMGEIQALIAELEVSIAKYKEEYAVLVSEAQAIKNDLTAVSTKVERSIKLLGSLANERGRWSNGSKEFEKLMATIVGDCFLSSAFLAYAGYFDQSYRQRLLRRWKTHLSKANIAFKHDISIQEFLSTPDERMRWRSNQLPDDDLCTENAIMLHRHIRYPLIIDPSGQAAEYIINELSDKKLTKTSFLDQGFRKNLESALRFGTPLLVQDAESYDPLINPVLNREVRRAGGRVLISVGEGDIDLSPTFSIILTTRNPAVQFPPDLCSRVTLINFTVTRGSLQTQCLNQALRMERPDVDKKRSDLLKLQGEFRLRLRQLEKELLQSLNSAKGSILDDDAVITKLERLKSEAAEVSQKVLAADEVMSEIEATSKLYAPLAQKCSAVFFTLEQLHMVHFLYRYSLQFFLDIFTCVLSNNPHLATVKDYGERLDIVTRDLFQVTYDRVAPGMLHEHRLPFALMLVKIYLDGTKDELPALELNFFMQGGGLFAGKSALAGLVAKGVITEEQGNAASSLATGVACFAQLPSEAERMQDEVATWLKSPRPETALPAFAGVQDGGANGSAVVRSFHGLLLLQAFRPDRVLGKAYTLIEEILPGFTRSVREGARGLAETIEKEITASTPVLLCGVSGYDPSGNVRDLYVAGHQQCTEIALGAEEAFDEADKAVQGAAKSGKWVVLKNVHLAAQWLVKLEKKLLTLTPHPNFRLFLTTEINPKLPVNLLRTARKFVYEPAAGVKASILRTLQSLPESVAAEPVERARVFLLLAWLHAVIQERLRYAPLGWSKKYEFGEPDLRSATDTIDTWITTYAKGRSHLSPDKIPWTALGALLAQTIYGGRVDNEIDQRLLASFVTGLFNEKSFEHDFAFVPGEKGHDAIIGPDGNRRESFLEWAANLPDSQLPTWLGLPNNAEMVLLTNRAKGLSSNMLKLQTTDDIDETEDNEDEQKTSGAVPAWMRMLNQNAAQWLSLLPEKLTPLSRTADSIKDPMFRYFEREINIGVSLLKQVRKELAEVCGACEGAVKQTNQIRALMSDLAKGLVPKAWKVYKIPDSLSVGQWVVDLAQRLQQFEGLAQLALQGKDLRSARVWMGGLFVPEAFVTATRQAVAQAHGWSLEKLQLSLDVRKDRDDVPVLDKKSFLVTSLRFEGAACRGSTLSLIEEPFSTQALTILRWSVEPPTLGKQRVRLPVYLNATRTSLVFMATFDTADTLSEDVFYKRGVAILCSSLSGIV